MPPLTPLIDNHALVTRPRLNRAVDPPNERAMRPHVSNRACCNEKKSETTTVAANRLPPPPFFKFVFATAFQIGSHVCDAVSAFRRRTVSMPLLHCGGRCWEPVLAINAVVFCTVAGHAKWFAHRCAVIWVFAGRHRPPRRGQGAELLFQRFGGTLGMFKCTVGIAHRHCIQVLDVHVVVRVYARPVVGFAPLSEGWCRVRCVDATCFPERALRH